MTHLHPNALRVQAALRAAGATAQVQVLADSTRTAEEAAAALAVDVGQIVKSLVFLADGDPVLVLAAGDHRVDVGKLQELLGAGEVRRADAREVRAATGLPIGGVAPLGHPRRLTTLVDSALDRYPVVWAAAGTPHAVFPTSFAELVRITAGRPADVG